ncbi:MAG: 2,3-bisphosphoglycerate-independent phosphoglycerate mutase [Legionellales bacterium]|nr:2,3-bisphosphoglycerate-independent phosphoglycerate mutase [Legionellales bacterium]
MTKLPHTPLALIILDGFGHRDELANNAIALAKTPHLDHWMKNATVGLIDASGHAVGLPDQQMGNSEVGHLNIGAGRVILQDLTRINRDVTENKFAENPVFAEAFRDLKHSSRALHILGLLSPGGVHSHQDHIFSLITAAEAAGVSKVYLHVFLDGRDTPPQSALASLQAAEALCEKLGNTKLASMCGRYYAMDRDNRWERIQPVYDLLTLGKAIYSAEKAVSGLEQAYQRGETDEFVKPTRLSDFKSVEDGDVIIFMNYRSDRARQLSRAFTDPHFPAFPLTVQPHLAHFITLTQYANDIAAEVAYAPQQHVNVLGEYLSQHQLTQLRLAETEKYAHVTFFFNGGRETPFPLEDRILIPSPKVATYDLQPEMSAYELTEKFLQAMAQKDYAVIICNFANADMVGHTGNLPATIQAIEVIDECLGKIIQTVRQQGGEIIITADHGNAEKMLDETTQQPHTAHTNELVPFIYLGRPAQLCTTLGTLADIAPTMLYLLGLNKPQEMTGNSLLKLDCQHA